MPLRRTTIAAAAAVLFVIAVRDALHLLPPDAPPLNVYTAAALFALGFGATAFSVAVYAMYRPPLGTARSSLRAWAGDWRGRALCVLSGALASGGDLLQFMVRRRRLGHFWVACASAAGAKRCGSALAGRGSQGAQASKLQPLQLLCSCPAGSPPSAPTAPTPPPCPALHCQGGDAAGYAAALLVQAHPLVGMLIGTLVLRELRGAGWRAAALAAAQAGAYAGSVALLAASAA